MGHGKWRNHRERRERGGAQRDAEKRVNAKVAKITKRGVE